MSAPSRPKPAGDESPAQADVARVGRQALFRTLNENIRRIADSFALEEWLELVCECAQGDCFARLSVARREYEAVRRFPARFLTRIDHVSPDERIVEEFASCVAVERVGDRAHNATPRDPNEHEMQGRPR